MPSDIVKSFAEKSGKSVQEVEALWNKAKEIVIEQGISEDDKSFYKILVGILKKMLKVETESATVTTASANVGDGQSGQYKKRFKHMFRRDEISKEK